MKKKRILFLFVTLFASTLLYSQVVGVKTNLVMDAMKMINLGAEVGLSKKLTLDLYANYNPWKYKDQKMMKMLAIQPELRYWFCDKFNGHFVGAHLHGGSMYMEAFIRLPPSICPGASGRNWKTTASKDTSMVQAFPTVTSGFSPSIGIWKEISV